MSVKGDWPRPRSITKEEYNLNWGFMFDKITLKEYNRRYGELKAKGLIKRGRTILT